jgi:hypothetical protein
MDCAHEPDHSTITQCNMSCQAAVITNVRTITNDAVMPNVNVIQEGIIVTYYSVIIILRRASMDCCIVTNIVTTPYN